MSDEQFLRVKGCIYRDNDSLPNNPSEQHSPDIWVRKDSIEAILEFNHTSQYYPSYIGYVVLHINSGKMIVVKGHSTSILLDMEDA